MAMSEKFHDPVPEQVEHCFVPVQVLCGNMARWPAARGSTADGSRKGQELSSMGLKVNRRGSERLEIAGGRG